MDKIKKVRGPSLNHEAILKYSSEHPELIQREIALNLGISQKTVSRVLVAAGVHSGGHGAPVARAPRMTDEEFKWERILHNQNLGMERGSRVNGQRIYYGHTYGLYGPPQESATLLRAD